MNHLLLLPFLLPEAIVTLMLFSRKSKELPNKRYLFCLKALASALFIAFALILLFSRPEAPSLPVMLIFLGLVASFAGDLLLETDKTSSFALGASCFALAHFFYIASFITVIIKLTGRLEVGFDGIAVFIASAGILWCVGLLFKINAEKDKKIIFVAYLFILAAMLTFSVILFLRTGHFIPFAAAFLFCFSDSALAVGVFTKRNKLVCDALCLYTYYPAQFLFALAVLYL